MGCSARGAIAVIYGSGMSSVARRARLWWLTSSWYGRLEWEAANAIGSGSKQQQQQNNKEKKRREKSAEGSSSHVKHHGQQQHGQWSAKQKQKSHEKVDKVSGQQAEVISNSSVKQKLQQSGGRKNVGESTGEKEERKSAGNEGQPAWDFSGEGRERE